VLNQVLQASQRIVPVFLLAAKILCLQNNDAVAAYALIPQLQQPVTNAVRQRWRRCDIESQVNGRRDLVDILPARTLGADRQEFDFRQGNRKIL